MEDVDTYILWLFGLFYGYLVYLRPFGPFYGYLLYFPSFGMLYQEEYGNPGVGDGVWQMWHFTLHMSGAGQRVALCALTSE
jgi:hypothetical protein